MKFFDEYFVFSASEKRGIFAFLLIIIAMSIFYWLIPIIFHPKPTDFSELEGKLTQSPKENQTDRQINLFSFNPNMVSIDSLQLLGLTSRQANNVVNYRKKVGGFKNKKDFKKIYSINDSLFDVLSPLLVFETKDYKKWQSNVSVVIDSLFKFDPNTVSKYELTMLGFSPKQSGTLINFRNKGGKFYKSEDLKKVYSVTDKLYQKLEPFIAIKTEPFKINETVKVDRKQLTIDLNRDGKEEFEKISGIGEKLSVRIIKYRDKLGGFHSVNQLKEVFGLDSTIINTNRNVFYVSSKNLKKININTITFKELLAHPYISYSMTKKIINYRGQHGYFKSVEEIMENNLINLEQYRKIAPYISIEK